MIVHAGPLPGIPIPALMCSSLLLAAASAEAQVVPPVRPGSSEYIATAVRVEAPPRLDGQLTEPVWDRAIPLGGFVQREPDAGSPATEPTEVRLLYTRTTLYLGIRCSDSRPDDLRMQQLRRDGDQSGDDRVEIILDTFSDGRNAYAFRFTPLGAKWDAQIRDQGVGIASEWDGVWEVKTSRDGQGWDAEVAIPFSTLRFPRTDVQRWGMNIQRVLRRRNEETFWTPVGRGMGEAGVDGKYRMAFAGSLEGLQGISPGTAWEFKPWGLGGRSSTKSQFVSESDRQADVGLDARYSVTTNFVADLTFNTDFAQVEADQEQINLDRFQLFYPEKREFFLEGMDIFRFGVTEYNAVPPFLLFYTRRLGLTASLREVPISTGAKLTGKERGWTVGALAVGERPASHSDPSLGFIQTPEARNGVLRITRDVMDRSRVGFIGAATDHGLDGRAYSAMGLDGRFSLGRNTRVDAFLAYSRNGDGGYAPSAGLEYRWNTDLWGVEVSNLYVDPDWGQDLGFVARPGVMRNKVSLSWSPRPDLPLVRQTIWFADTSWFTRPDGTLESRLVNPGGILLLDNGGEIIFGAALRDELVESDFMIGDRTVPADRYAFSSGFILLSTDRSRIIGTTSQYSGGTHFNGERRTLLASLWWRPSAHFGIELIRNTSRFWTLWGQWTGTVDAARVTWTPSTVVTAKLFTQENASDGVENTNLLLSWRYRPRSYLYLVYDRRVERGAGFFNTVTRDRTLLLKLTYLWSL